MQWVEVEVQPVVKLKNEDELIVGPVAPNAGPQFGLDKKANKYVLQISSCHSLAVTRGDLFRFLCAVDVIVRPLLLCRTWESTCSDELFSL